MMLTSKIGHGSGWILLDRKWVIGRTRCRDLVAEQEALRQLFESKVDVVSAPRVELHGAACNGFGHCFIFLSEPGPPSK